MTNNKAYNDIEHLKIRCRIITILKTQAWSKMREAG